MNSGIRSQVLAWLVALSSAAFAGTDVHVDFTIIAETGMSFPGGGSTYQTFDLDYHPQISRGDVFFKEQGHIFRYSNGAIVQLLTNGAAYPTAGVGATTIRTTTPLSEDRFAISGTTGASVNVALVWDHGVVSRLVPDGLTVEGTTNVLPPFTSYVAQGTQVAVNISVMYTVTNAGQVESRLSSAWYRVEGTTAVPLIQLGPSGPGGSFVGSIRQLAIGPTNFAMIETLDNQDGVVLISGDNVATIARASETMPGGTFLVSHFDNLIMDENGLAFGAKDGGGRTSLCRYYEGELKQIIGTGSPLPGSSALMDTTSAVAYDGGNMAIIASSPQATTWGIYLFFAGEQHKIIEGHDMLGPWSADGIYMDFFSAGLSGNSVVFRMLDVDPQYHVLVVKADLVFDDMLPVTSDYDGDGSDDKAFYDEGTDTWFIRSRKNDFETRRFGYGATIPVPGDFDGDGISDLAVYDPPFGNWYILASQDGFRIQQFGYDGAQPAPKDYDGDGRCDLGVYDERTGEWFILKTTEGFQHLQFGFYGATPIPADFDNDGKVDIAVYEHARGNWYILASAAGFSVQQFGYYGVTPVPVDFDGGGADFAVFDPRTGDWYSHGQVDGFQLRQFGYYGVRPVSADYDGDAKNDLGVYDQHSGTWYLLRTVAGFRSGGL